jgi:hypothetical protein
VIMFVSDIQGVMKFVSDIQGVLKFVSDIQGVLKFVSDIPRNFITPCIKWSLIHISNDCNFESVVL